MAENLAFIASFFPTKSPDSMELVPPETALEPENRLELASCCQPAASLSQACSVRFLNAAALPFSADVLIDGRLFWQNVGFGKISEYVPAVSGFHTVVLRRSDRVRAVLYQNQFPFQAGQRYTLAAVDSPSGGVSLLQLSDTGCACQSCRFGCCRIANISFPGSSFDIRMANGDTVFSGIDFGRVSPYKQAAAGSYRFFATEASALQPVREMPVILQAFLSGSLMAPRPLLSYSADICSGKNYTTYLIGNSWTSFPFQALTVEDQ